MVYLLCHEQNRPSSRPGGARPRRSAIAARARRRNRSLAAEPAREPAPSLRSMTDGFDVVPVRIEDERGVVGGMIMRANAGAPLSRPPAASAAPRRRDRLPALRCGRRHAPATWRPASGGSRRTDCVADRRCRTRPSPRTPSADRCRAERAPRVERSCYVRNRRPRYRCDQATGSPRPSHARTRPRGDQSIGLAAGAHDLVRRARGAAPIPPSRV